MGRTSTRLRFQGRLWVDSNLSEHLPSDPQSNSVPLSQRLGLPKPVQILAISPDNLHDALVNVINTVASYDSQDIYRFNWAIVKKNLQFGCDSVSEDRRGTVFQFDIITVWML